MTERDDSTISSPAVPLVGLLHRSPHHATASGYARLAEFVEGMQVITGEHSRTPYRVQKAVASRLPSRSRSYNSLSVAKEQQLIVAFGRRRRGVAHYFDAERDAYFGPALAPCFGWVTSGSFHYPPSILREVISRPAVRRLDATVALASNQAEVLADIVGGERVHLIPLGVDTDFFCPAEESVPHDLYHVLLVGQHLRDFDVFADVVESLKSRHPDLRVTAVLLSSYSDRIPQRSWISVRSGIDDVELRLLYRSASCLVLPLRDAAACTAIVEAMACGLPVVTTDVGGTVDYVPDGLGIRCRSGDAPAMADAISGLFDASQSELSELAAATRRHALGYSLPVVARQMQDLLRSMGANALP